MDKFNPHLLQIVFFIECRNDTFKDLCAIFQLATLLSSIQSGQCNPRHNSSQAQSSHHILKSHQVFQIKRGKPQAIFLAPGLECATCVQLTRPRLYIYWSKGECNFFKAVSPIQSITGLKMRLLQHIPFKEAWGSAFLMCACSSGVVLSTWIPESSLLRDSWSSSSLSSSDHS